MGSDREPMLRPGWGIRLPALADILATHQQVATQDAAWANGTLMLRFSAYTSVTELPDELVRSVRCLVQVDDKVVVCTNTDGISHPWPGGRREPGETFTDTACREVHEETGWLIEPDTITALGWLHGEHLEAQPADWPYPHPDFLQIVVTGRADRRDGGRDVAWVDTEGYEASSTLMTPTQAAGVIEGDPLARVFLDLIKP
jgi:ADP-ribose pyrophosphatase YjhB (NUDIX family)